jgi:hypothetical protein
MLFIAHDAGQQHLGWHVAVLGTSDTSLLRAQHARMRLEHWLGRRANDNF